MGITYKVYLRFLHVPVPERLDLTVLADKEQYEEGEDCWKEKLRKYYVNLKANTAEIRGYYKHTPCNTRTYYSMLNVPIPLWYEYKTKTNVLLVSNFALGRRYKTLYTTIFYDSMGAVIEIKKTLVSYEVNRFVLLIPPETHSLRYTISPEDEDDIACVECAHFYNFTTKCITCDEADCCSENESNSSSASTVTYGEHDDDSSDSDESFENMSFANTVPTAAAAVDVDEDENFYRQENIDAGAATDVDDDGDHDGDNFA
jgi:hypothetical protein